MADTDKMYTSVAAEKKKMQLLKGELDALDGSKADKATVAAGSYNKVTVNSQGIVTAGENPTTLAGHGIQDAYTKTEVNGLVDTPHQNYVTVQATSQTTDATDVLPASGQSADTIYRVSNWDGSANSFAGAFDVTVYSEYAWDDISNPNKYVFLAVRPAIGEVFDISVYNNNATYPDLSAALGTNGANVPAEIRRGGMSVKFVHTSDNKYVRFNYLLEDATTNSKFINVNNWQGVDEEPAFNSKNLVMSGGVAKALDDIYFDKSNSLTNASGNHINYIAGNFHTGDVLLIEVDASSGLSPTIRTTTGSPIGTIVDTIKSMNSTHWQGKYTLTGNCDYVVCIRYNVAGTSDLSVKRGLSVNIQDITDDIQDNTENIQELSSSVGRMPLALEWRQQCYPVVNENLSDTNIVSKTLTIKIKPYTLSVGVDGGVGFLRMSNGSEIMIKSPTVLDSDGYGLFSVPNNEVLYVNSSRNLAVGSINDAISGNGIILMKNYQGRMAGYLYQMIRAERNSISIDAINGELEYIGSYKLRTVENPSSIYYNYISGDFHAGDKVYIAVSSPSNQFTATLRTTIGSETSTHTICETITSDAQNGYSVLYTLTMDCDRIGLIKFNTTAGQTATLRVAVGNVGIAASYSEVQSDKNTDSINQMSQLYYPSYYNSYIQERISAITNNLLKEPVLSDSFVFITDPHVVSNRGKSGILSKYIFDNTPCRISVFGGDVCSVQNSQSVQVELVKFNKEIAGYLKQNSIYLPTKGNHDFYNRLDSYPLAAPYQEFVNSANVGIVKNELDNSGCYYYYDNKVSKMRYIIADSHDKSIGSNVVTNTQAEWLAESAFLTTPNGYGVIFVCHVPFNPLLDTANENESHALDSFVNLIGAAANKSSNVQIGERTFDFSAFSGNMMMVLNGHTHKDIQTYKDGVLYVSTACDAAYNNEKYSPFVTQSTSYRTSGTTHEQAFDVVQILADHSKIQFTRIGNLFDRLFNLGKNIIAVEGTVQLTSSLSSVSRWVSNDAERSENNKYDVSTNTWSYSSDVCSVDSNGLVTGLSAGEAFVFAEDDNHNKEFWYIVVTQ